MTKVLVFDLGGTLMEYVGMPDEMFKNDISSLLPYFDFYVSSLSCGFRKPNSRGLEFIAEHYEIPVKLL